MTARYEERSVGVFDRLAGRAVLPRTPEWGEYQRYMAETGEQPDPIPPGAGLTLTEAQAEKSALVENLAGEIRRRVTGRATAAEMASWNVKAAQAKAFAASGNPADAPQLAAEAEARGVTLQAIVDRVTSNATLYLQAEATIAGVKGKHKDAIAALADAGAVMAYDITQGWGAFYP